MSMRGGACSGICESAKNELFFTKKTVGIPLLGFPQESRSIIVVIPVIIIPVIMTPVIVIPVIFVCDLNGK